MVGLVYNSFDFALMSMSICTWGLRASFFRKEQATTAIKKILDEDVPFNVAYESSHREGRDCHDVVITEMSWAINLGRVAEILAEVDEKP